MARYGHPRLRRPKACRVNGRTVLEHRLVWEKHHGPIPDGMQVHHTNGDERDNRVENLQLVTPAEHRHIHAGYELREGVWWKRCRACGEAKPLSEFYRYCYYPYDGAISYCKPCHCRDSRERQRKLREQRRLLCATTEAVPGERAFEGPCPPVGPRGEKGSAAGQPYAPGGPDATGASVGGRGAGRGAEKRRWPEGGTPDHREEHAGTSRMA